LKPVWGGRLDATNVVRPEVSVITNISLDHQAYLGNTLSKIAAEKAGIIKDGIPVVIGVKAKKALEVIQRIAAEKDASLYRLGKDFKVRRHREGTCSYSGIHRKLKKLRIGLCGAHQVSNAAVALCAIEVLIEKRGEDLGWIDLPGTCRSKVARTTGNRFKRAVGYPGWRS
jgi:dihydrofolate synthase/folylpolyglutamate synthase